MWFDVKLDRLYNFTAHYSSFYFAGYATCFICKLRGLNSANLDRKPWVPKDSTEIWSDFGRFCRRERAGMSAVTWPRQASGGGHEAWSRGHRHSRSRGFSVWVRSDEAPLSDIA